MAESLPTPFASNDPEQLLADRAWLVRVATALLGDRDEAEDLAQEVQVRALTAPPRVGDERPWLRRVAQNVASRWRARRRWRANWERGAAKQEGEPSSAALVARVEAQRAVADAVLKLAEPDREVVLLRFFDDLAPAAIAARLGLPVETVRTRLKRALARLRERLDAAYGGREAWSALLAPWMGVATMQSAAKVAIATGVVVAMALVVQQTVAWRQRANGTSAHEAAAAADAAGAAALEAKGEPSTAPATAGSAQREVDRAAHAEPAQQRVRVTGRVVDAVTREALPGARIEASRRPGDLLAPAFADEQGAFTLEWPAREGRWFALVVTERDHAPLFKDSRGSPPRPPIDVVVDAISLGELALETGAVVRGRVVRLPERLSVADAELFVLTGPPAHAFDTPSSHLRPQGRSDGSGRFELAEHVASQREAVVLFARTETGVGFAPIALLPGRARLDDVEVDVEPPGELLAIVTDGDGAPIAGATVQARPLFPPMDGAHPEERATLDFLSLDAAWRRLFEATTGADGSARLPLLPEGRHDPAWDAYAGHMQSYLALAKLPGGGLLRAGFLVKRGETTRVELSSGLHAPAAGRRKLILSGRITSDGGAPVPDATIRVRSGGAAQSDEAGLYVTSPFELRGDELVVEVTATGFAHEFVKRKRSELAVGADDGAAVKGEPHDAIELDVVLRKGLAIRGVVLDERNQPVERVGVRVARWDDAGTRESAVAIGGATRADGHFSFEGLAAGEWRLEADGAAGFRHAQARTVTAGDEAVVVRLVHEWPAHARLVADVVDAASGEPLDPTEAHVHRADHLDGSGPAATLELGKVVVDRLFPDRWEIELRVKQGGRLRQTFAITSPQQELHLKLAVAASAELLGRVTWPEGKQPNYAGVFLMPGNAGHAVDGDGRPLGDVTDGYAPLAADGSFHFKDVLPGKPLRLWIDGDDLFAEAAVLFAAGERKEVELVPIPSAYVTWRLVGALPPGRGIVYVSRDGEVWCEAGWSTSPDRDSPLWRGRFNPGPLRWRVRFTSDEAADPTTATTQVEGKLEVAAGHDVTIDVAGLR